MGAKCAKILLSGIQPPGSSQIDGVPSKRWQLNLEFFRGHRIAFHFP
jgi:hypothetical protein